MNARAKDVIPPDDVLEQCLVDIDRTAFTRADAELQDADKAIRTAEMNLHRLEREANEAKLARKVWETRAAQLALEGSTPQPYDGPDVSEAQRMHTVGLDTVAAMKTASQQVLHRRALARETMRAEVNRRLVEAYVALAGQLVLVHAALEAARDPNEAAAAFTPHWRNLVIPAPRDVKANDDGSLYNFHNLTAQRADVRAVLRSHVPEIIK